MIHTTAINKSVSLAWAAALAVVLLFFQAAPAALAQPEEMSEEQIAQEWSDMSANDTRRVFNFGIGSLMSWGGRQHTFDSQFPTVPELVTPAYPVRAVGIQRSFNVCWRYVPVTSIVCNAINDESNDCPPVVGASFEVTKDTYPSLRRREAGYDILQVQPELPLPQEIDPNAFMFAWADVVASNEPLCSADDIPSYLVPYINTDFYPVISQAYWDYMIGGILAWDGQLLDTKRYTWDLDAELQSTDQEAFAASVAVFPSLSLEERRQMAVDFVKTSEFAPTYEWINDRACPFTGNGIITPQAHLAYPAIVFGDDTNYPAAYGTVSPIASDTFCDYVDEILMEGGWEFGARNSIHDRINPCLGSGFINRTSEDWTMNAYYEDVMDWRKQNGITVDDESFPANDAATDANDDSAAASSAIRWVPPTTGYMNLALAAPLLFIVV